MRTDGLLLKTRTHGSRIYICKVGEDIYALCSSGMGRQAMATRILSARTATIEATLAPKADEISSIVVSVSSTVLKNKYTSWLEE